MSRRFAGAGAEPSVQELLDDPIAKILMRHDGIEAADVLEVVRLARDRLDQRMPRGEGPVAPFSWIRPVISRVLRTRETVTGKFPLCRIRDARQRVIADETNGTGRLADAIGLDGPANTGPRTLIRRAPHP